MRHKAIAAGVQLPLSYQERLDQEKKESKGTLDSFVKGPTFTVDLLNLILVVWIVRHALPWARFEDVALRAAFYTANRGATVRSTCWASKQSVQLFSALHDKAITTLQVSFFNSSTV